MSNKIERSSQEKRTAFVVVFAFCVMLAEIVVGLSSHSMALFADGVHMGSHVLVIGLNWAAYVLVRYLQNKGYDPLRYRKDTKLSCFHKWYISDSHSYLYYRRSSRTIIFTWRNPQL